jgi:c-di-AMP phosphodiesterase-like protein
MVKLSRSGVRGNMWNWINAFPNHKAFISQRSMSNGFIYVVDAHFIDKIEEKKYPGPKCLCMSPSLHTLSE